MARVLDEVDRVALGHVVAVARAFEHRRAVEPVADRRAADRDGRVEHRCRRCGRDVHRLNGRTSASGTPSCRRASAGTPGTSRRDRPRCAAFGGTTVASRVMRSIASVSVGYAAAGRGARASPRRAARRRVRPGLRRECRARRRAPAASARSRPCRRTRRATRCGGPVEASASTMWREAYASACSAARYQHARSSTSSRSCTPASAPVSCGIGERRTVAEHTRLPVAVDGDSRRITVRSRARRGRGRASANGSSPSCGRARDASRAPGRGTRRTRRSRLRCTTCPGRIDLVVRPPDAGDVVPLAARARDGTRTCRR